MHCVLLVANRNNSALLWLYCSTTSTTTATNNRPTTINNPITTITTIATTITTTNNDSIHYTQYLSFPVSPSLSDLVQEAYTLQALLREIQSSFVLNKILLSWLPQVWSKQASHADYFYLEGRQRRTTCVQGREPHVDTGGCRQLGTLLPLILCLLQGVHIQWMDTSADGTAPCQSLNKWHLYHLWQIYCEIYGINLNNAAKDGKRTTQMRLNLTKMGNVCRKSRVICCTPCLWVRVWGSIMTSALKTCISSGLPTNRIQSSCADV